MYFCNYLLSSQNAIPKNSSTSVEFLAALVPDRRASTASVYNQKNSFHSFFSPPQLPKATCPRLGKEMEERYRMTHYLRYCCAMLFALFSFLLATPLSAQAQTREAYVSQSEDEMTLTFYYDALRSTRTGTTWGIEETKKEGDDTFPAWAGTWDVGDSTTAQVVFDASFRDFRPTTTVMWFYRCEALKQIEGLEYLNTSKVKDMGYMFYNCWALTSLDLKNFNTQNVIDMSWMFSDCWALTSLDLQHFNTQNVTDMSSMFYNCTALTSLDLQHFNTKKVTYMYEMFSSCAALTTINSNTAWQCPESENMFAGCTKLKGAVAYNKNKVDAKMANPETGYFTAKPTTAKRNRRSAAHLPAASKR